MAVTRQIGPNVPGSLSDALALIDGKDVELSGQTGNGLHGVSDEILFTSIQAIDTLQTEIFTVEALFSKENFDLMQGETFGLSVRDNLDMSSSHFSAMFSIDDMKARVIKRSETGVQTDSTTGSEIPTESDVLLRISRSGNEFRAYIRVEGSQFNEIGSASISLSTEAEIGLVLVSPNSETTIKVSSFSLSFGASTFQLVAQSGPSRTTCLEAAIGGDGDCLFTATCHALNRYQTFR